MVARQCGVALKVIARHDEQIIAARVMPECVFGVHRKPAGRGDRAALKAEKLPLIELFAGEGVGGAKWLYRVGEAVIGKRIEQQNADRAGGVR